MNLPNTSSVGTDAVASNGRDAQLRQLREHHQIMLALSVFIILAAFFLRFSQGNALRLPWTNTGLPATCASRALFGVECPGCGLTRSFVALAAGNVAESFRFHRVGWLIALTVVIQIPYRLFALHELRRRTVSRQWLNWTWYVLIAALVINWTLKMLEF